MRKSLPRDPTWTAAATALASVAERRIELGRAASQPDAALAACFAGLAAAAAAPGTPAREVAFSCASRLRAAWTAAATAAALESAPAAPAGARPPPSAAQARRASGGCSSSLSALPTPRLPPKGEAGGAARGEPPAVRRAVPSRRRLAEGGARLAAPCPGGRRRAAGRRGAGFAGAAARAGPRSHPRTHPAARGDGWLALRGVRRRRAGWCACPATACALRRVEQVGEGRGARGAHRPRSGDPRRGARRRRRRCRGALQAPPLGLAVKGEGLARLRGGEGHRCRRAAPPRT